MKKIALLVVFVLVAFAAVSCAAPAAETPAAASSAQELSLIHILTGARPLSRFWRI